MFLQTSLHTDPNTPSPSLKHDAGSHCVVYRRSTPPPSHIRCLQWCVHPGQNFLCLVYFSCSPCTCVYTSPESSFFLLLRHGGFCAQLWWAFVYFCVIYSYNWRNDVLLCALTSKPTPLLPSTPTPTPTLRPSSLYPPTPQSQRGSFPLMHLL